MKKLLLTAKRRFLAMSNSKLKFCVKCKYYTQSYRNLQAVCIHAKSIQGYDLVHGHPKLTKCETMRLKSVNEDRCGPEGKLWEEKQYIRPKEVFYESPKPELWERIKQKVKDFIKQ
jgi:hypothetical protein